MIKTSLHSSEIISFSMFSNVWVAADTNFNNPYDIENLTLGNILQCIWLRGIGHSKVSSYV